MLHHPNIDGRPVWYPIKCHGEGDELSKHIVRAARERFNGLFNINITIRQLIKSVANKEGAHSDPKYDPTLRFIKSVKLVDQDIHIKFIVAIGEYILKWLKRAPEQLHP